MKRLPRCGIYKTAVPYFETANFTSRITNEICMGRGKGPGPRQAAKHSSDPIYLRTRSRGNAIRPTKRKTPITFRGSELRCRSLRSQARHAEAGARGGRIWHDRRRTSSSQPASADNIFGYKSTHRMGYGDTARYRRCTMPSAKLSGGRLGPITRYSFCAIAYRMDCNPRCMHVETYACAAPRYLARLYCGSHQFAHHRFGASGFRNRPRDARFD